METRRFYRSHFKRGNISKTPIQVEIKKIGFFWVVPFRLNIHWRKFVQLWLCHNPRPETHFFRIDV